MKSAAAATEQRPYHGRFVCTTTGTYESFWRSLYLWCVEIGAGFYLHLSRMDLRTPLWIYYGHKGDRASSQAAVHTLQACSLEELFSEVSLQLMSRPLLGCVFCSLYTIGSQLVKKRKKKTQINMFPDRLGSDLCWLTCQHPTTTAGFLLSLGILDKIRWNIVQCVPSLTQWFWFWLIQAFL